MLFDFSNRRLQQRLLKYFVQRYENTLFQYNMLTSIIIDDEPKACANLSNLLSAYCPKVEVLAQFGKPSKAISYLTNNQQVDCIFLDIEMPEINGFDFIKRIGQTKSMVVFVTGYASYALRAIKANALEYLLKPIKITDLQKAARKLEEHKRRMELHSEKEVYLESIQNALLRLNDSGNSKIRIPSAHGFRIIDSNDIVQIHADGGYSRIQFENQKPELVTKNIGHFEEILQENKFVRIHHSCIINLDFLSKFSTKDGGVAVMKDGSNCLIAKRRMREFKQKVDEFYS